MTRFSQHLIKRGLLTEMQLEEALQHQAVYGARLGTNLVELRMIRVDQLAECLSEFHKIALPPRPWLERPKRAAVERVTRPLVERIRFIPLRLESNVLHAAVLDPNDPRTLDDLRFATGCKIQPYVLPEIWMHDWLFALFKLPRGIRHIETDADSPRELNEPAQAFDFQAAQAALAAKAAKIMVPATVGVVAGEPPPPNDDQVARKTMQGADARKNVPGEARPVRQTLQGEMRSPFADPKTIGQGEQRPAGAPNNPRINPMLPPRAPGDPRPTMQGAPMRQTLQGELRSPVAGPVPGEARPTSQGAPMRQTLQGDVRSPFAAPSPGEARPTAQGAPKRQTLQGEVRSPLAAPSPGEARPTAQGRMYADPRAFAAPPAAPAAPNVSPVNTVSAPFEGRANISNPPSSAPSAERVNLSEFGGAVIENSTAPAPSKTGASVRPPPVSMRSLTELGGRVSQVHAPVYAPAGANSQVLEPVVPWDPETGRISAALPPPPAKPTTIEPAPPPPPPRQPSAAPVAVVAPPPPPARLRELSEIETALRNVPDREQLLDLSFEIAARFARVSALFIVHRGMIQGVRCMEDGVTRSIQGVLLPLEAASMLTQAVGQSVPFRVDPRLRPLDARLHRLLTEQTSSEVGLFPVSVKTRVVNLLYASHGSDPLGTIAFGALSLLATEMGAAYGQLILQRKGS
jgi:hypothetical protein